MMSVAGEPYPEIMLDLETMGINPDAAIVSIGAIRFNLHQVETYEQMMADPTRSFYRNVDLDDCLKYGLSLNASSLNWWFQQSPEAIAEIIKPEREPLKNALAAFSAFAGTNSRLWGNGAAFDNAILKNSYVAAEMPFPLQYDADRCYRTLKALVPEKNRPEFVRQGTFHNALDDAISQALYAQKLHALIQFSAPA